MGAAVIERAREMRDQERQASRLLVDEPVPMRWRVSRDVYDDILRYGQDGRPRTFQVLTRRLYSWTVDIDASLPAGTLLLEPAQ